jgi:hypothetical protein
LTEIFTANVATRLFVLVENRVDLILRQSAFALNVAQHPVELRLGGSSFSPLGCAQSA